MPSLPVGLPLALVWLALGPEPPAARRVEEREHRHYATVDVGLIDYVELLKHRPDVLFHSALAHEELGRDRCVAASRGHGLEDLYLALGQVPQRRLGLLRRA